MKLILASSSPGRKALLARLQLPFSCIAPDIDESILPGEAASDLVMRLARAKAAKVNKRLTSQSNKNHVVEDHIIVAADQVAGLGDKIFTKPLTTAKAENQLTAMSNQLVTFFTGVCLMNQKTGSRQKILSLYQVCFRNLTPVIIADYLAKEQPLQCAGSFQSEGLGITLVKYFKGDDPTSLIGLPLIQLSHMLAIEGLV